MQKIMGGMDVTTISAKVVLSSMNGQGPHPKPVLHTLLLRYPRWIHSEFMTHRALSKNAASSRAIPVEKMIQAVLDDPAVPVHWLANQPGMVGGKELDAPVMLYDNPYNGDDNRSPHSQKDAYLQPLDDVIEVARAFTKAGYHKQCINRLLEPWAHITVLASGTEWENFFALRCHPDAEPHMQDLAWAIKAAIDGSVPQVLKPGEWHLPFVSADEIAEWEAAGGYRAGELCGIIKSVACCASTSYKTVDGFDMSWDKARAIFTKLASSDPPHASPFEHPAFTDTWIAGRSGWHKTELHANYRGFIQARHAPTTEELLLLATEQV